MSAEDGFKIPSLLPQDLLLIHDIVGTPPPPLAQVKDEDDICSSGSSSGDKNESLSDAGSEDEVEGLVFASDDDSETKKASKAASETSSDSSSSSEDDSEDEAPTAPRAQPPVLDVEDDDEGGGPPVTNGPTHFKTAHEVGETDAAIIVPTISEVDPTEVLEHVGEIMTVLDRSVIVRGLSSGALAINSRALDAETLLVFEDRKVLGHVFETFGPTYQPLYVVKFPSTHPSLLKPAPPAEPLSVSSAPADGTEVLASETPAEAMPLDSPPSPSPYFVSRAVFHVPRRSNFVFVNELKRLKGSDASNVYDEEPTGHDAVDFSDDEEEARYKRSLKGAGEKRKRFESETPGMRSRAQTPAHMQDQELAGANDGASVTDSDAFYGANPYDAHGPYDSGAGGGRTLVSYDDPYAEAGPSASSSTESGVTVAINDLIAASQPPPQPEAGPSGARPPLSPPGTEHSRPARGRGRGRGRGGPGFGDAGGGRGRGRGQMREQRGRGRGRGAWQPRGGHAPQAPGFDARQPPNAGAPAAGKRRELSPTSLAIARATGQYTDGSTFMVQPPPAPGMNMNWGMPPGQQPGLGMGQAPVQGHINPRFAAQWAMNGGWSGTQAWGGGWPPTTGYPPPPGAGGT